MWSVDGGLHHLDSDSFLTCPYFSCDLRDFRLVVDPLDYKLLDYRMFAFTLIFIDNNLPIQWSIKNEIYTIRKPIKIHTNAFQNR